jgi:hypothetical protein
MSRVHLYYFPCSTSQTADRFSRHLVCHCRIPQRIVIIIIIIIITIIIIIIIIIIIVIVIVNLNSMALVRERTIPTERLPLVGDVSANVCG